MRRSVPRMEPLLLNSITDAGPDARGRVALSGSHGGLYPAALASRAGLRAVIFNDAGIGLDEAGVAGVMALESVGMAAAAVDCMSCRIGDAADMAARGVVSVVNAVAASAGAAPGMAAAEAARLLTAAPAPVATMPPVAEARRTVRVGAHEVRLLDSASLVVAEDAGRIVVTGSHGGLIGGDPARALKAAARLAVFNDAGFGPDRIGAGRLPALEARGVAALTVSCGSARIGDAASALETGEVSAANAQALAIGASPGRRLKEFILASA